MVTSYTDNPTNIDEIMPFIISDKEICSQEILFSEKCFFYDACAFRKHINLKKPEYLFEFIKRKNGIVIVLRTIIMELASESRTLNTEYIDYLKKIHEYGLKILVMYEEDVFDILSQCFTTIAEVNKCLGISVKVAKNATGTVSDVLKADKSLREEIMATDNRNSALFSSFFCKVRNSKESGDNMGEEMIAICIHMLANIPESYIYKYIVMTEDKGAIRLINKTQKNIVEYINREALSAVTTIALGQKIYQENIITTKEQVEDFISTGLVDDKIKIVASEEYDLCPKELVLSYCDVADKIVTPNAIRIYY